MGMRIFHVCFLLLIIGPFHFSLYSEAYPLALGSGCCGGRKLLGSLHQLLLVERKEMKGASGDGLHIFF